MNPKEGPPESYYDNPRLPNDLEAYEWDSLLLTPEEAFHIMVQTAGDGILSERDGRALRQIYDGEMEINFFEVREGYDE